MPPCPELPGVRHEYVDAGSLRMHVALAGPEDAPAVFLVHGWPQNWWTWRHVIPALSTRFRVIAPDLRGHGWTEAPSEGYEKEQLATDLLALLNALGLERVIWVGHDWGGWTGFLAAFRAPERLDALLALCIPHPWSDPHPSQLAMILGYQGPVSLPLVGGSLSNWLVPRILQSGRGESRLDSDEVSLFAGRIPGHVSVAMYRTHLTRELVPIVRGRYGDKVLKVPTTVMVGSRDLVTKGARPGPVQGQPDLSVEVIEGVAHWVPEQRAENVVSWVEGRSPRPAA